MKHQRGFIAEGALEALLVFAAIGLASAGLGICYVIYWLFTHMRFV